RIPSRRGVASTLYGIHRRTPLFAMSEPDNTLKTLLQLAAKRFKVEVSKLDADDDFFDKLGIDSFQAMELLTDVEDEFEVEIPDYELQGINTFAGMAEVIGRRL